MHHFRKYQPGRQKAPCPSRPNGLAEIGKISLSPSYVLKYIASAIRLSALTAVSTKRKPQYKEIRFVIFMPYIPIVASHMSEIKRLQLARFYSRIPLFQGPSLCLSPTSLSWCHANSIDTDSKIAKHSFHCPHAREFALHDINNLSVPLDTV